LELAAIVTGNPERQREAQLVHPGATIVENAERLWENASQLDLVVIATPNRTHVPLALAALDADLNVVVDKPLAPAAVGGRQLIEAARRKARMLTVFQNRRWDGDFLTLRRLLDEGSLGVPYRLESRFDRWRPAPKSGWRERGAPEEAGGLLYDLGSHLIDQALVLFGAVSHVYAELDRRRALVEVDDDAFVALEHVSGARSHLFMSVVAAQPGPRFRITGSRAAYVKHGLDVQEAALRRGEMPGQPAWGEEPPESWGTLGSTDDHRPVRTEPGAYQRFYEGVVAAIRDGSPVPVDPEDAVAGLEIIEAARRSHTGQRVIAVS
jgi:predicted dehydrogenase